MTYKKDKKVQTNGKGRSDDIMYDVDSWGAGSSQLGTRKKASTLPKALEGIEKKVLHAGCMRLVAFRSRLDSEVHCTRCRHK